MAPKPEKSAGAEFRFSEIRLQRAPILSYGLGVSKGWGRENFFVYPEFPHLFILNSIAG